MSEPVLERSVLERKERDELLTIARAMGASPPSRARKADLVDLILTSAGIGPSSASAEGVDAPAAPPKPKPRRRSRAAALVADTVDEPVDPDAKLDDASVNEPVTPPGVAADAAPSVGVPADARTAADARPLTERAADDERGADRSRPEAADARTAADARPPSGPSSGDRPERTQRPEGPGRGQSDGGGRPRPEIGNQRTGEDQADEPGPGNQRPDNGQNARGNNRPDNSQHSQHNQGNQRTEAGPGNQRPDNGQNSQPNQRTDGGPGSQEDSDGNRRRRRRGRDRDQRGGPDESFAGDPVAVTGLLDLRDEGYGFLRTKGYLPSRDDVYVSVKQVRQFGLRKGDHVLGASRPASKNEKNPALLRIDQVNEKDPEAARRRPRFDDLTPLFPDTRLRLETPDDPTNVTARMVDLVSPIGKGQRGLIVSPPKAGKTAVLKQIVRSIEANDPDVELLVLLVDERPEEVTDMRRSISGEVIASTFDRPAEEHTAVAELVIERAKRLVEDGRDVVVILDGITSLTRAYNLSVPPTGRILSGGVDSGALYPPKKFFGSARNVEDGGSLTILATALIETGSKTDEVIFEEFTGTGNMELRLDRHLAERRVYPAIDVAASSTRHEELLVDPTQLQQVWRVRRAHTDLTHDGASSTAALERLIEGVRSSASNAAFLEAAAEAAGPTDA